MRRANDLGPNTGIGRVFWSSWGRVSCCELSDGKVRDVVRGLVDPIGLALDARNNRIFWSDAKAGKVRRLCSAHPVRTPCAPCAAER